MVHKPKHRVHSFRGLLSSGGQDEINLERQNINLAYRIIKFQLVGYKPGDGSEGSYECIAQIMKESTAASGTIDFSNTNLLAVGLCFSNTAPHYSEQVYTIFGNEIFSRNIYISQIDVDASRSVNYYIELEEVPVTAATLMQLKLGVARKLNLQQD